jgi:hypothetical protein
MFDSRALALYFWSDETTGERLMTEEYWTMTKNLTAMSLDDCIEYS